MNAINILKINKNNEETSKNKNIIDKLPIKEAIKTRFILVFLFNIIKVVKRSKKSK